MGTETIQSLGEIAGTNTWGLILPELTLGILALGLLMLEVFLPKFAHGAIPRLSIAGQLVVLAYILFCPAAVDEGSVAFGGMIAINGATNALRIFFLIASVFVTYLAMVSFENKTLARIEYFATTLVITGALSLMSMSNHFVMLFVALETATVGFYILVSYFRTSALSLEAGLKYLIMGALSSAILLFGIVLLYGAAGNPMLEASTTDGMNFQELKAFLAANPTDTLAVIGMLLVISGIAFKIGAFPFQIWVPDVYQGAPLPTTAFLAISSKAAGFAVLLTLTGVFAPLSDWLVPLLSGIAALTILFGNFAALTQRKLKRVIGLSGVSHAGFLLIGVVAAMSIPEATNWVIFYLFAYLLGSVAVFGVLAHLPKEVDAELDLDDLGDLAKKNGFLGIALAIGIGSLAGIPPLAGFIGKFLIFVAAFKAELYTLLAVGIIGVVISIYYYFGVIKAAFFDVWNFADEEEEKEPQAQPGDFLTTLGKLAIGLALLGSVVLGFFQGPLGAWLSGQ
ncbi:NADH-quinone oxidoreductase subunit N [Pelagicoccus sp. SDUM812003]|uniref:NADH-quinone oxidoreductase subunit N n=1 Tax=Pelagicoccus sp. SDUM812003 TaxID=3041267 RepID=UPI00280E4CD1|nr:NADH-quinone oxidoreductase subunit N [Pelagicoccus sp. SDUM812003]MDQ8202655.1 NADH-quinone oxidoreductase subunit N [Pelagicoccus sp. SDUM812003]